MYQLCGIPAQLWHMAIRNEWPSCLTMGELGSTALEEAGLAGGCTTRLTQAKNITSRAERAGK